MWRKIAYISLPIIAVILLFSAILDFMIVRDNQTFSRLQETQQKLERNEVYLQEMETIIEESKEDWQLLYVGSIVIQDITLGGIRDIGQMTLNVKQHLLENFLPITEEDYSLLHGYIYYRQNEDIDPNRLRDRIIYVVNERIENLYRDWGNDEGRWNLDIQRFFQIHYDYDSNNSPTAEEIEAFYDEYLTVEEVENFVESHNISIFRNHTPAEEVQELINEAFIQRMQEIQLPAPEEGL